MCKYEELELYTDTKDQDCNYPLEQTSADKGQTPQNASDDG